MRFVRRKGWRDRRRGRLWKQLLFLPGRWRKGTKRGERPARRAGRFCLRLADEAVECRGDRPRERFEVVSALEHCGDMRCEARATPRELAEAFIGHALVD